MVRVLVTIAAWKDHDSELGLRHGLPALVNLNAIAFDHRIRQQLVRRPRPQAPSPARLRRLQVELEVACPVEHPPRRRIRATAARRRWSCLCGSNTDGLSVTNTRARILIPLHSDGAGTRSKTRSKISSTCRNCSSRSNARSISARRQAPGHVGIGKQQRLEVALLGK